MNLSLILRTFFVVFLAAPIVSANFLHEGGTYGPRCRDMRTYPFVSCQPQCAPYSLGVHQKCQTKQQFGCLYRKCSAHNFECRLESQSSCPNGEAQVRTVSLKPNFPVEFDLAVNLRGFDIDIVLLLDASESTRPRLNAVKNELSSFVRQLNGVAHVGVAIYGGEESFDEKGMQILSPAQENVQAALNALDNLPVFPDGPRTTLSALFSVQTAGQAISLRGARTIIALIGDTPGREPDCSPFQFDRDILSRSLYDHTSGTSVMPVTIGGPGLDAALSPIAICENGYGPPQPQGVPAGQASKLAEQTQGAVVSSITASALLQTVDQIRRKPNRVHQSAAGAQISISTASVVPVTGPYYPTLEPINGCGDKVIVTTTGIPNFVSEPAQIVGRVKLDLKAGICQSGPFTCTIRVLDHVRGNESMSHWTRPITYYKKISVHGC